MAQLPKPTAIRLQKPSWRDSRLVVGVVLVLLSMTVGAKAIAAADDTVPMYAAQASLVPGQLVTQRDVKRVDVQLGVDRQRYVAADHDIAPDTFALRDVRPGELLPRSALGPRDAIDFKPVSVRRLTVAPLPSWPPDRWSMSGSTSKTFIGCGEVRQAGQDPRSRAGGPHTRHRRGRAGRNLGLDRRTDHGP